MEESGTPLVMPPALDCWYLTGPTAAGKTSVGLEMAQLLQAEIISLDSMAVYRGMTIGTAKPTAEQLQAVPHHLIDVLDPVEEFSVSSFVEAAHRLIGEIRARGREVLFVGGTPMYLKAMLRGIYQGPPADWEFRSQVEEEARRVGIEALHERLSQVDPLSAEKLHKNDAAPDHPGPGSLQDHGRTDQSPTAAVRGGDAGRTLSGIRVGLASRDVTSSNRRAGRMDVRSGAGGRGAGSAGPIWQVGSARPRRPWVTASRSTISRAVCLWWPPRAESRYGRTSLPGGKRPGSAVSASAGGSSRTSGVNRSGWRLGWSRWGGRSREPARG